jgi:hypothetical protein
MQFVALEYVFTLLYNRSAVAPVTAMHTALL